MKIRRVVAGIDTDGKSRVLTDGPAPRSVEFQTVPGLTAALIWSSQVGSTIPQGDEVVDHSTDAGFAPNVGESLLVIATYPPDTSMMRADFDAAAFGEEFARLLPVLADTFEPTHPGVHRTDSIDYCVVLEGEITLELDDGQETLLRARDVVIQHGNRHAWRNKSNQPATMLFVLTGVQRAPSEPGH